MLSIAGEGRAVGSNRDWIVYNCIRETGILIFVLDREIEGASVCVKNGRKVSFLPRI